MRTRAHRALTARGLKSDDGRHGGGLTEKGKKKNDSRTRRKKKHKRKKHRECRRNKEYLRAECTYSVSRGKPTTVLLRTQTRRIGNKKIKKPCANRVKVVAARRTGMGGRGAGAVRYKKRGSRTSRDHATAHVRACVWTREEVRKPRITRVSGVSENPSGAAFFRPFCCRAEKKPDVARRFLFFRLKILRSRTLRGHTSCRDDD